MCSRYYIDPDMMEEISRVVQNIDGRIRLAQGDIRPTDVAPVIGQSEHGLELGICRWGYPLSKGKNPVINARVETVMDKQSTDDSHFNLGKDFIVIDCTTEISINPVNQKLFFLNLPVRTVEIKFVFLIYIIVFS